MAPCPTLWGGEWSHAVPPHLGQPCPHPSHVTRSCWTPPPRPQCPPPGVGGLEVGGKRRTRGGHSRQHPPPPETGAGLWDALGGLGGGVSCAPPSVLAVGTTLRVLSNKASPCFPLPWQPCWGDASAQGGGGGGTGMRGLALGSLGGGEGGYTGTCAPGDAIPPDTHREGLRGGRVVRVPCPPPQNSLGPPPKSRAPPSPPQFRQQGPPRRRPPEVRKRPTSPTAAPGLLHRKPPRRHSCGKRGPATPNPPHGGPLCPPPCPYMGPHGGGRCYWAQLGPQYGTGQDWASAALGCWALVPHSLGAALLEGGGGKPRDPPELGRALPARP